MIHKRDLGPYPVICKRPLLGKNKYVSKEIGAANAGMQITSAAGGNSWIPPIGGSGAMFDAEDAQVQERVQRLLRPAVGNK